MLHRPESAPPLITGLADRLELLAETGLDATLVVHYTREFAAQEPEEFVRRYLVDALHATVVVIGRDVRFGRGNSGDLRTMVELGEQHGFEVQVISDVHGGPDPVRRWSSTWVRELLAVGDVGGAARDPGPSAPGPRRGGARRRARPRAGLPDREPRPGARRAWSRPTACTPAGCAGSATRPTRPDGYLPVAISIGTNPTFDGHERRVEAHVPDRSDLELYGEEVVVEFVEMLRPTVRVRLGRRAHRPDARSTSRRPAPAWPAARSDWGGSRPAGNIAAP